MIAHSESNTQGAVQSSHDARSVEAPDDRRDPRLPIAINFSEYIGRINSNNSRWLLLTVRQLVSTSPQDVLALISKNGQESYFQQNWVKELPKTWTEVLRSSKWTVSVQWQPEGRDDVVFGSTAVEVDDQGNLLLARENSHLRPDQTIGLHITKRSLSENIIFTKSDPTANGNLPSTIR